jgi:hypothetical protein
MATGRGNSYIYSIVTGYSHPQSLTIPVRNSIPNRVGLSQQSPATTPILEISNAPLRRFDSIRHGLVRSRQFFLVRILVAGVCDCCKQWWHMQSESHDEPGALQLHLRLQESQARCSKSFVVSTSIVEAIATLA